MKTTEKTRVHGIFTIKHMRDGKILFEDKYPNIVVDEGLAYLNKSGFRGGSASSLWYIGLFGSVRTPLSTDIANDFSGNAGEITATELVEATRTQWVLDAEGGTDLINSTVKNSIAPSDFTFRADVPGTVNVQGAFLINNNSQTNNAGATDVLMAASEFGVAREAQANDVVQVTYELTLDS